MKTLEQELNRIKNELTDIGRKTMFGKTCEELVQEIITIGCPSGILDVYVDW